MNDQSAPGAPPPDVVASAGPPAQTGFASRIRNYFLTGLIVAGPVAITLWLVWSFVTWVDTLVKPLIPVAYRPETYLPIDVPGLGLIIAFVSLTTLGFLAANLVGRTLVEAGEILLDRMPIVRPLYRGLKQVFETLFSQSGSSFRKVGLVEFPGPGRWSIVFLSSPPGADISAALPEDEYVSVFLPCTPNPTTGFFFYMPRHEVLEIDITPDSAARLIMTVGMAQPGSEPQRTLSQLAEHARAIRQARAAGRKW